MKFLPFLILLTLFTFACSNQIQPGSVPESKATPSETPKVEQLTVDDIKNAFENKELPMFNVVKYTEETDPNKLLNRPSQYIGKLNFTHRKMDEIESKAKSSTIEVFANMDDLNRRKSYLENIIKTSPFVQYMYANKNTLLRIDGDATPTEAEKYKKVFESL